MENQAKLDTLANQWLELGAAATKAWNEDKPASYGMLRQAQYKTALAYMQLRDMKSTDQAVAEIRRKYTH